VGGAAASSTVQRIDLDREVIICIGRVLQGKDYEKYLSQFVEAVNAAIPPEAPEAPVPPEAPQAPQAPGPSSSGASGTGGSPVIDEPRP
jgi:hypothetical protein